MKGGMRVALGVAVGYFLGRTRKMKVALMLAGAGATGRLPSNSRELVREGIKRLGDSAEVGKLTESVRGELTDAAKRAAVAAASNRIDALTDRIGGVGSGAGAGVGKVSEGVGDTVDEVGKGLLGGKEPPGEEEGEHEEPDEKDEKSTEASGSAAPKSRSERTSAPRERRKRAESEDDAEGGDQVEAREGGEPRRRSTASPATSSRRTTPRTRKDSEPRSRTRSRSTTSTDAPVRRTGR